MKLLLTPLRLALLLFCMFSTLQNTFADNNKYRIYAQVGETKYYMTGEPTRDGYINSTTDVGEAFVFTVNVSSTNKYSFSYIADNGYTYYLAYNASKKLYSLLTSVYYFSRYSGNGPNTYQFCPEKDSDLSVMFQEQDKTFITKDYTWSKSDGYYDLKLELVNSFDLTVSSAGYATLCLPFNADVPSGVELYAGSYANGRVTLVQPQSGKVHSGEGYIVRATPGTYTFSPISELFNKPEENKLVGVTERTDLDGTDGRTYIFKQQDGVVGFYRLTNTGYIGANKAYLKIDALLDSRSSSRLGLE